MLKSHERFYSRNGKRLIMIVDDEEINREMLKAILEDSFEFITACNGVEALDKIRQNRTMLSLVILDLMMPGLSGHEVLTIMKEDEELRHIPVIVLTSDSSAEVLCLRMGASDFITKPYDAPEVIRARAQRAIELGEDSFIIKNTERDELTGLLNKEFFFRYSDQYNGHHPNVEMDAVTINIKNFHLINETRGRAFGDRVLSDIGAALLKLAEEKGGIAGRGDADTFMLYLPKGSDYPAISRVISRAASDEDERIRIRMGVYTDTDRTIEVERCFDRSKVACDMIRKDYNRTISYYDSSLHQKELKSRKLVGEMKKALKEKQFVVWFQPKVDISGASPSLVSAEALIRWKHPELGMVSPGIFVPVFEENGLIQELDRYVWRETAYQMKKWKERYGHVIPVSVNISRNDMYAQDFVPYIKSVVTEFGIDPGEYYLEITESAYTEDSDQLIEVVNELRKEGFRIEMDDFGSGYSSLNMLAELPCDVLKLDMRFIKNLMVSPKSHAMVELVMQIAKYLEVTVVAEGVDTEEQVDELKRLGCQRVQGSYFSMPVTAESFEEYYKGGFQC